MISLYSFTLRLNRMNSVFNLSVKFFYFLFRILLPFSSDELFRLTGCNSFFFKLSFAWNATNMIMLCLLITNRKYFIWFDLDYFTSLKLHFHFPNILAFHTIPLDSSNQTFYLLTMRKFREFVPLAMQKKSKQTTTTK